MSAIRLPAITEKQFMSQVTDLATILGWHHYHPHDSRRSVAGWPDLCLIRPPRFVAVELKTDSGRLTREQRAWLDLLGACDGIEVHLWRPADWAHLVEVLR